MRRMLILFSALLLAVGCGDNPALPGADPVALRVTAPADALPGEPFSLTIEAERADGSAPVPSVGGAVNLTVSPGTITPTTADLVSGTATLDVLLSVTEGPVEITATQGTLTGTATVNVGLPRILPGDPTQPAVENIPDLFFVADPGDYTIPHPDIPGIGVSHNVLLLALDPTAATGEVNGLLADLDAVIAGGIPGVGGVYSGLLVLRLPFTGHAAMDSLRAVLDISPLVDAAAPDHLDEPDRVPSSVGNDALWLWDPIPLLGNWGFELCRVPQMWNLKDGLERRGLNTVPIGVIDTGVAGHEDLTIVGDFTPQVSGEHGTHVAGTMAANHGGGGVDGVTPYAALHAAGIPKDQLSDGQIHFWIKRMAENAVRVVNISIGKRYLQDPTNSPATTALMENSGNVFRAFHEGQQVNGEPVLIVASAGNSSAQFEVPARFNSSRAYAALELGWPHVIVVEAANWNLVQASRAAFSNTGAHISAPGEDILSTIPGNTYGVRNGTSMAAPFVSGLVAYLLAVDGGLTHAQILDLLQDTATPVQPTNGLPGAPLVDAFNAALDIDRMRGNRDVLHLLLDIDDGTPDGNQRVDPETGGVTLEMDADNNGGVGDGVIDMSDFRRWRDLFLEARHKETPLSGLDFDGPSDHPKRDVNGDGTVTTEAEPFPLADFNGDGHLDPLLESVMAGGFSGPATDLDVLASRFFDFIHEKEDLPNLVFSGDVTVDVSLLLQGAGSDEVWSAVENELGPVESSLHSDTRPVGVYTLSVDDGPYTLVAYRRSALGDTTCLSTRQVAVTLGGDAFWRPFCPSVDIEVTLAEFVTPGSPSPLGVRAGITQPDGSVEYKAGIQISLAASGGTVSPSSGVTDASGFFTGTGTLSPGEAQLVVTVIADDPESGAGTVATAVARPIVSGDGRVVIQSPDNPWWYVDARNQSGVDFDSQTESVKDILTYSGSKSASTSFVDGEYSSSANSSASLSGSVSNEEGQPFTFMASGSVSASVSATQDGCSLSQACASGSASISGQVRFAVTDTMSYAFDCAYEGYNPTSLPGYQIVLWDDTEVIKVRMEQGVGKSSGQLVPGRSYRIEFVIQLSSHYITTPSVQASGSLAFFVF